LNNSAVQDGVVTVSPLAGSRDASANTQISFLGVPARDLSRVSVVGSKTGAHAGRLAAYSQGNGASFLPARRFAAGERVTMRARLRLGGSTRMLLDQFVIATENPLVYGPGKIYPGPSTEIQSFLSRPDLHPPAVTVTASSPLVAPGEEFVAPYAGPGQAGPMILNQSGELVWFKARPPHTAAANFTVQSYQGRPVLTWWQGSLSEHGFGRGEDMIADSTYTTVAQVRAGNGLRADLHDFQLTPNGTALITAYNPIRCNLAAAHGPPEGAVTDGVMQEIDIPTGLVMYEWTSIGHVGLSESYERARTSSANWPFDFFHINSISLDEDGSILVSARNTWTVYEIDGRSGQVIWRLGGKQSSFKGGPGTGTAWQHDPHKLADGSISVFDNGASPSIHHESRGVVLDIDQQHRTAKLLSQFTHGPPLVAESQGNMQALDNGDWFMGWGQTPYFSEYGPDGKLLFDAHFPAREQSYRAFRFTWTGTPAEPPAFTVTGSKAAATVYASWDGATSVAAWRVLAGATPATLRTVAQVPSSGFETPIGLPAGTSGPDVAVQALDGSGRVLGSSAVGSESALA
jgi:hypothetical protein